MPEHIMRHQSCSGSLLQLIPSSELNPQSTETDEPCVQYPSIPSSSQTLHFNEDVTTADNQSSGIVAPQKCMCPNSPDNDMANPWPEGLERPEFEGVKGPSRKRSHQTCQKCGRGEGCRGNTGVKNCTNSCRDCGRMDCVGRNSQNPKQRCSAMKKA